MCLCAVVVYFVLPVVRESVLFDSMYASMCDSVLLKLAAHGHVVVNRNIFAEYLQPENFPGGKIFFRLGKFVRDAGGGGWNGPAIRACG